MTPPRASVAPPPAQPSVVIRSTHDLLSVIPFALGYHPRECLLVVCVRTGGGLGLLARTDLDDLVRGPAREEVATLVAARVADDGATAAYVVAYTAGDTGPSSTAVTAARAFARALDPVVGVGESWVVGPRQFWSLDCADPACCPADGYPLEMLESTVPGAELVLAGRSPLPSREDLYRVQVAAPERRGLVRKAAERSTRARTAARASLDGGAAWRSRAFADWLDAADRAVRRSDLPAALLGRLVVALEDREVRDAVLLWFVPGNDELAAATASGGSADPTARERADRLTAAAIASVVDTEAPARPDRERVRIAETVLEAVVAHAARERSAAPLTLLGFLAWWSGEGTRARFRVGEALAADPEHRLALLLASALAAGLAPGWVRSRSTADVSDGGGAHLG